MSTQAAASHRAACAVVGGLQQRLAARSRPRTRCCGTTLSAARAPCRPRGPAFVIVISTSSSAASSLFAYADLDDPVPVVVEDPGVEELVLRAAPVPARVLQPELVIGERGLRIVVAPPVPGVAGQRVQVPPVFLDVLAVVALGAGEAEQPFLEEGVAPVPQREPDAQPLLDVAEPGEPVLAPPVGARAGVIMRQVAPGVAVLAVVLADRAPLPLADVGPPCVPGTACRSPSSSCPNPATRSPSVVTRIRYRVPFSAAPRETPGQR